MDGPGRVAQLLRDEAEQARSLITQLFSEYDGARIPERAELEKKAWTKKKLLDLIDSFRDNIKVKAKRPRIEDACYVVTTSEDCRHISWEDLCVIIRREFRKRNIKCDVSVNSMRYYPSQRGYLALSRKSIDISLLEDD